MRPDREAHDSALENAEVCKLTRPKRRESEREERECPSPQAEPAHSMRGQGMETRPPLFLTSTHFKLSFHRSEQGAFGKPRLNVNTRWYSSPSLN